MSIIKHENKNKLYCKPTLVWSKGEWDNYTE